MKILDELEKLADGHKFEKEEGGAFFDEGWFDFYNGITPERIKALIAVARAVKAMKEEMMKEQIWYCGIGCEFAEDVDAALAVLEKSE